MSDAGGTETLQRLRRALQAIDRLQARLDATREAVAIVGMGCRFPGADGPEAFAQMLFEGREGQAEVPADRWDAEAWHADEPATPGRMSARRFGVVGDLENFDAAFFGIAPREAKSLDPQQRLLLEVAWEALEAAGIAPSSLKGSRTGVYTAACGTDFFQLLAAREPEAIDAYFASGTVHSMASGRVSYLLGLNGPSLTVDTACSSSLVAVHLAVKAIRAGECDLALAGGVNRIILPTYGIAFSQSRMLAPDGRCKTFSAAADGYGRAEGAGMVVLKRLSAAERDGDRILGVIRGSAVNQDGASSGLTVPNGPAQQAVIRAALSDARLEPADVAYVEAHGTGTALGDPIETGALAAVFADGRSAEDALLVGSVKTNIGHAEGAAGIAGLIKAVIALRAGTVPPHLNGLPANPMIDWADGRLKVPHAAEPFPERGGRRIAGVSAFGFSGTNAHVVVEAPPPAAPPAAAGAEPRLLVLSAADEAARAALAARYAADLADRDSAEWADICRTAGTGRSALAYRIALVAESPAEAAAKLASTDAATLRQGRAPVRPGKLAFVFTGQGAFAPSSQATGLGLLARLGAFRDTIQAAAAILDPLLGLPFADLLADPARLAARTDLAQPVQFALQAALLAAYAEVGVVPDLVLGHSLGEFTAAHAAGVMDLATGLTLTAARGKAMQRAAEMARDTGAPTGMLAVGLDAAEVARRLPPGLVVAADNGPRAAVVAGPLDRLDAFRATLPPEISAEPLPVPVAFHSSAMEAVAADFAEALRSAALAPAAETFLSALTGAPMTGAAGDPETWRRQIVEPVRFRAGVEALAAAGVDAVIEIGPRPLLLGNVRAVFAARGIAVAAAAPLGRGDDRAGFLDSLGALFVAGHRIDFAALDRDGRRTRLPTYPWQRVRHWPDGLVPPRLDAAAEDPQAGRAREVDGFYSRLTGLFAGLERHAKTNPEDDVFLTYAPFPAPVPGFSWIRTSLAPEERPEHFRLMLEAQRAMRRLLFRHVDFDRASKVLDFGCGHGSDLVALARRHPHLTLLGQTIAAGQADVGRAKAARAGFADRIEIRHADSARSADGGPFDLVFGFEVIHHVADKAGLFGVLGRALAAGGRLVAADLIATETGGIEDGKTLSGFMTAPDWAKRLAENGLVVSDLIDVSRPVADFLLDDDLEASIAAIGAGRAVPGDIAEAFRGFVRLGRLLAEGLARYVLLDAEKRPDLDRNTRMALNCERLARPVAYDTAAPERWRFERRWIEAGAPDPAAALREAVAALPADPDLEAGRAALPRLEAIALGYAARALAGAGPSAGPHRARVAAALDRGSRSVVPAADPEAEAERFRRDHPAAAAELDLVVACGRALPEVIAGSRDPVGLLFPDGDMRALRRLYGEAPVARAANRALAEAARRLARPGALRCLEIGAGTGGSTGPLLDALDRPGLAYDFSDLSNGFLAAARARFGARPGFRALRLDIEADPAAQNFEPAGYDLIVAANVLHATADLAASLAHAVGLLAPGGVLLALEGTAPRSWVDLTFGLTDGWWRFSDRALRPDHPLVDCETWRALGRDLGLEVATIGLGAGLLFDQSIVALRRPAPAGLSTGGTVLVHGEPGGPAEALVAALRARGRTALRAGADDLAAPDHAPPGAAPIVLHLADTRGAPDPATAAEAATRSAAELLGALARRGAPARLLIATVAAVAAGTEDRLDGLAAAGLWGLGATARLEHPEWRLRRVDLDPAEDLVAALLDEIDRDDGEDQIARRGGRRLAPRLARLPWPAPARIPAPPLARPDRTVLVTGGTRGLGLATAERLVRHGARHVVLIGRNEPPAASGAAIERMRSAGATVVVETADAGDPRALAAVVARAAALAPIGTVIHAAGSLADRSLAALGADDIAAVLGPKIAGAWTLHAATLDQPVEHFVLFSSAAGALGSAGQANHAAANAWLDEFARFRRARGLPALAVGWGAWAGIGAAASRIGARETGGWTAMIAPEAGLDALTALMAGEAAGVLTLPIDWAAFAAERADLAAAPVFADLLAEATRREADPVAPGVPTAAGGSPVRAAVAAVLELAPEKLDPARPLTDYGLDSLMAITLRNRIRRDTGVEIRLSTLLDRAGLARLEAIVAAGGEATVETEAARPPPPPADGIATPDPDEASADDLLADLLAEQPDPGGAP